MVGKLSHRELFVREMNRKARARQEEREARRQEACDEFQASWLEMNERIGVCWAAARRLVDDYGYSTAQLAAELSEFLGADGLPKRMASLLSASSNPSVQVDYSSLLPEAESGEEAELDASPSGARMPEPDVLL